MLFFVVAAFDSRHAPGRLGVTAELPHATADGVSSSEVGIYRTSFSSALRGSITDLSMQYNAVADNFTLHKLHRSQRF